MVRDASVKTQDMLILNEMDMTVFNKESVRSYRQRMRLSRPGHVWEALEDEDFLLKLGAVGIGSDGKKHPTSAGLLMFGNEYDIVREFNAYFLDYQEQYDADTRWTDRIISSSGDWSGIVLRFQVAVGSTRPDELAVLHGLPLLRLDLAPNVQRIGFIYHVPQRDDDTGMSILRVGGVEVFVDRNEADVSDAEILLDVVTGVNGVPSQTGEVFHNDAVDVTSLNIREHLLKARTVEVCPGRAVVDVGIVHADLRVLLQIVGNNHLLGFNGYAVRVGILHRKADIDRGAASGVGLLHGHRSRFFPAFSRHAQPTFLCS